MVKNLTPNPRQAIPSPSYAGSLAVSRKRPSVGVSPAVSAQHECRCLAQLEAVLVPAPPAWPPPPPPGRLRPRPCSSATWGVRGCRATGPRAWRPGTRRATWPVGPGASGASDCRDSFVSRCRIALVPLGRSGSNRRAFYRVTGADLANLVNLRQRGC